jgi:hypothetical protein
MRSFMLAWLSVAFAGAQAEQGIARLLLQEKKRAEVKAARTGCNPDGYNVQSTRTRRNKLASRVLSMWISSWTRPEPL